MIRGIGEILLLLNLFSNFQWVKTFLLVLYYDKGNAIHLRSKWAIFGKQNWRCGMNRTQSYGARVLAHEDPIKGVGSSRQQDGGHGSWNPPRSV